MDLLGVCPLKGKFFEDVKFIYYAKFEIFKKFNRDGKYSLFLDDGFS